MIYFLAFILGCLITHQCWLWFFKSFRRTAGEIFIKQAEDLCDKAVSQKRVIEQGGMFYGGLGDICKHFEKKEAKNV